MKNTDGPVSRAKHPLRKGTKRTNAQQLTDRAVIGWPLPLPETTTPLPVSSSQGPGIAPKIPKSPQIDPRNLGSAKEALHSHPANVSTARSPLQNDKDTEQNRKCVIYENPDGRLIIRRPGRPTLFISKAQSAVLEQILSPESQQNSEERKAEKTDKPTIPTIQVTRSSGENVQDEAETEHICENTAYKDLYKNSQRNVRALKRQVKRVVPLAFLVSDAEDVDIEDTTGLIEKLEWIIEDSKTLVKVLPLITALCEDQRIKFDEDALRILPRVLEKVLADSRETRRARQAAGHYKRAKKALECRMKRMEDELARLRYSGEEEYIYNP